LTAVNTQTASCLVPALGWCKRFEGDAIASAGADPGFPWGGNWGSLSAASDDEAGSGVKLEAVKRLPARLPGAA
jgi:hypothetical protein